MHRVFHKKTMECPCKISRLFPHGNSTGHETGIAILQDGQNKIQNVVYVDDEQQHHW